jgi:hypothetical protein
MQVKNLSLRTPCSGKESQLTTLNQWIPVIARMTRKGRSDGKYSLSHAWERVRVRAVVLAKSA